jgi:hypothetical protein
MPRELFARHWGKLKEIFGKSTREEEAEEIAYRQSA